MRFHWPVTCRPDRAAVLVTAISARALADAARRAGFVPLVADLFGDLDTRAIATRLIRLPGSFARGLRRGPLLEALDRLAEGIAPEGVVYGAGFEDRPSLLHNIARRYRLIGNTAETVARLTDPISFAALCRQTGVPHPRTQRERPARGGWLEKRTGGAGGMHVRTPSRRRGSARHYYQREVEGRPVSALFLADGNRARLLGFSEQWTDPTAGHPFRYGGAVQPAVLLDEQRRAVADVVSRLVAASGLVGLCSADFMLRTAGFDLLEINPRPGATLDIYRDPLLFGWHVESCRGQLPEETPTFPPAAAAVVYARGALRLPDGFVWPEWTADRQPPGDVVAAGAPLCTVLGEAETAAEAREIVLQRGAAILASAGAA